MSHPSASTEPLSADSEPPPADVSGRSRKGNRDTGARTMTLVVSVLVGTGRPARLRSRAGRAGLGSGPVTGGRGGWRPRG
jgi:hypothetical protein